jgi:hypothetical protein
VLAWTQSMTCMLGCESAQSILLEHVELPSHLGQRRPQVTDKPNVVSRNARTWLEAKEPI